MNSTPRKIVAPLACFLTLLHPAFAHSQKNEWQEVAASRTSKAYLDRESILRHGKYVQAWTLWSYPQGKNVQDLHYKSLKSLIYYDCKRITYAIRQTHYFSNDSASGRQIESNFFNDSELEFINPAPGSTGDVVLKTVCVAALK